MAVVDKAWDGDAGRFSDEEYERSCVLDRKDCGGDWADKPPKARCALPIKEPNGDLNRNGVHAAAQRIGSVENACPKAVEAAKSALRSAYKELGEDAPASIGGDSKKSVDDALGADRLFDRFGAIPGVPRHGQEGLLLGPGFEVRSSDNGVGVLHGHFAVFNRWTEINSFFEGRFMEQMAPGAFKKTLEQNKGLRCLFQHGRDPQIGMKPLGAIQAAREDDTGAAYEVPLFDVSYVRDLVPGLKAGQFGASFRFQVVREEVNTDPGRSDWNPEGIEERTVTECKVREFGPVTFPAYEAATAGVRSIVEDCLRDEIGEAGYAALTRSARYYTELLGLTRSTEDTTPGEETRSGAGPSTNGSGPTEDNENSATEARAPDGLADRRLRTTRLPGSRTPLRTSPKEDSPPWKL